MRGKKTWMLAEVSSRCVTTLAAGQCPRLQMCFPVELRGCSCYSFAALGAWWGLCLSHSTERRRRLHGDSLEVHAPLSNPVLSPFNPTQLVSLWAKDHLRLGHRTQPTADSLCHCTTRTTFQEDGRGSYFQLTCQLLFGVFWKCLALTSTG